MLGQFPKLWIKESNYPMPIWWKNASATKWSKTLKKFVGFCRRVVWVCSTILWGWSLKCYLGSYFQTVCSCHVTYVFQRESTFYCCLNVKELLAWSRREIWGLSDCNWTRTQNHLVLKRTLNHLARWLSVRLRTKWFWFESSCC